MENSLQIPSWVKDKQLIWYEIRGSSGAEVNEYLPGIIRQVQPDSFSVKVFNPSLSSEKILKINEVHFRTEDPQIVENLTDIPSLNDAELLHHLHLRYQKNQIYCFCGLSLIAINPYMNVPHETSQDTFREVVDAYQRGQTKNAKPHIWTVAAQALYQAGASKNSQAICINGESGAGKTVTTKLCLDFVSRLQDEIAEQASRRTTLFSRKTVLRNSVLKLKIDEDDLAGLDTEANANISERILACNPLLEAFGNAKTCRNDNSSRFGKYIKLYMDLQRDMRILGAVMENYLLEKTRVVQIDKQERTFHIFYAMCRFMDREKLQEYGLLEPREFPEALKDKFSIFSQSEIFETAKVDDKEFYEDVVSSFETLNFSGETIDAIWRVVGSILFLQNLHVNATVYVEGAQPCSILKDANWAKAVSLLGVDGKLLEEGLTVRKLIVNNKEMKKVFSPSEVKNYVRVLAKELYNNMFNWLFRKLNGELKGDIEKVPGTRKLSLGVLDIFGFEIFDNNSLEQLFINYANEKLQGLYVEDTFKNECLLFESEGLGEFTSMITYSDNLPLMQSLDNSKGVPIGVFPLTDQYSRLQRTDDVLMASLKSQFKASKHITFHKFKKDLFFVKHTARQVEYKITDFIEKNKDEVSAGLIEAIQSSKYMGVLTLFNLGMSTRQVSLRGSSRSVGSSKGATDKFLAKKFVGNMGELMAELKSGDCHFVRCIKPNEFKRANHWVSALALRQIRYMGLLDSLKVRKNNYPNRFGFKEFYVKYQDLDVGKESAYSISELETRVSDFRPLVDQVLESCERPPGKADLLIGRTKVLINQKYFEYLQSQVKVKQQIKIEKLGVISRFFKSQIVRQNIRQFFIETANGLALSRDVLSSMQAKIDYKKFKKFLSLVRKVQAAFRIQKHYRLMSLRKFKVGFIMKTYRLFKLKRVCFQTVKISRLARFVYDRTRFLLYRKRVQSCRQIVYHILQRANDEIAYKERLKSIQHLQASIRGFFRRQKMKREYVKLKENVHQFYYLGASLLLQSHYRGYRVRKRFADLINATKKIQSFMRTKWLRNYFLNLRHQTVKIQRIFRQFRLRKMKNREMLSRMIDRLENQNSFQAIENAVLYGVDQKTTVKYVFEISQGHRKDFIRLIQSKNAGLRSGTLDGFKRTRLRSLSRERGRQERQSFQQLYQNMDQETDPVWRKIKATQLQQNLYVRNLSPGKTWRNFEKTLTQQDQKLNQYVSLVEKGELSSQFPRIRKDLEDQARRLRSLRASQDFESFQGQAAAKPVLTSDLKTFLHQMDLGVSGWPSIELPVSGLGSKSKARMFAVPLDIQVSNETPVLYPQGFVKKLIEIQKKLMRKQQRILHIQVGDTFAMVISDRGKVYSFGFNDRGQLAKKSNDSGHSKSPANKNKKQPFYVENLSLNKAKMMSLGGSHGIFLDQNDNLFTWGDNSYGQLGLGHNYDCGAMNVLNSLKSPVSTVKARGCRSAVVTQNNEFILWDSKEHHRQQASFEKRSLLIDRKYAKQLSHLNPFRDHADSFFVRKKIRSKYEDNRKRLTTLRLKNRSKHTQGSVRYQNEDSAGEDEQSQESEDLHYFPSNNDLQSPTNPFRGMLYRIPTKTQVVTLAMGHSFLLMLTKGGRVLGQGDNTWGQCGVPVEAATHIPHLSSIEFFSAKKLSIKQVDCGLHHSIVLTNSKRVFTFGANESYQLGTAQVRYQDHPLQVFLAETEPGSKELTARNVCATSRGSCVLTEDYRVFFMGAFGVGLQKQPRLFPYELTFFPQGIKDNFVPIRLYTSWSSSVSVTYLVLFDFSHLRLKIRNNKDSITNNFVDKWLKRSCDTLFAPYAEHYVEFISSSCFLKQSMTRKANELDFPNHVVFEDPLKQELLRNTLSKQVLRPKSVQRRKSRSAQRIHFPESETDARQRETLEFYLPKSKRKHEVQNNLMVKNLKFNSVLNVEEETNSFIRPGQLRKKVKKKEAQREKVSYYDLHENPEIPEKVQSDLGRVRESPFDSLNDKQNLFLNLLEGTGRFKNSKKTAHPRYGRKGVNSPDEDLAKGDNQTPVNKAKSKYENPFHQKKSRKSKSPVRRPSSPFKNLKDRQREKSIKKLEKSFSKIVKEREQQVRFEHPEFLSNKSFGGPTPSESKSRASKNSAKKSVSKRQKSVRKSKKSHPRKIPMDQILKHSDPSANEIKISRDHLLSQMQTSNLRFKTSKVINQLKYGDEAVDPKVLKSSMKKGVGRFGHTPEKQGPKVMFDKPQKKKESIQSRQSQHSKIIKKEARIERPSPQPRKSKIILTPGLINYRPTVMLQPKQLKELSKISDKSHSNNNVNSETPSNYTGLSFRNTLPNQAKRFSRDTNEPFLIDMPSEQDDSHESRTLQRRSEMPLSRPKTKSPFRSKSMKKSKSRKKSKSKSKTKKRKNTSKKKRKKTLNTINQMIERVSVESQSRSSKMGRNFQKEKVSTNTRWTRFKMKWTSLSKKTRLLGPRKNQKLLQDTSNWSRPIE